MDYNLVFTINGISLKERDCLALLLFVAITYNLQLLFEIGWHEDDYLIAYKDTTANRYYGEIVPNGGYPTGQYKFHLNILN